MNYRATKISSKALTGDLIVESGRPVTVFGIVVTNSRAAPAEVTFVDKDIVLFLTVTVAPTSTIVIPIEFIARNGIRVQSIAANDVFVCVFHSSPGA